MNPSIFKAYDIRGIYPTDINEQNFEQIVRAIYEFFKRDLKKNDVKIALGRDMRISSPSLFEVAKKTLISSGAHITDVGLTPTPTFYYSVLKYNQDAGIMITASHNPKDYAGIKFVKRDGGKIVKIGGSTGMDDVKKMALDSKFPPYTNNGKLNEEKNALEDEVMDALSVIDVSKIKPFKVVCDPANGMGALYLEKLFEKIPGELIKMNFDLDGTFPAHPADPLDFENLIPLQEKVKELKADLGIEPDGDGDRVFFVSEKGGIIPATSITSLIAEEALKQKPGSKIIVDIRYTRNASNIVKKNAGQLLVSRVGHAFITEDVNREGAFFAGESSGHFYFGETGGAESAVKVILYVLLAMSETDEPISKILKKLQTSYESGEINFKLENADSAKIVLHKIEEIYNNGEINKLDGIAIDYPSWRFNIRASNTEPLLRLNLEAENEEILQKELSKLLQHLDSLSAKRR